MSISVRTVCQLAFGLFSIASSVAGFGAASSLSVTIVGIPGGGTQSLPISYVQSFQRWVVEDGRVLSRVCNGDVSEVQWNDKLQIRPTLDVLTKSGAPSYAMAGLQVKGNDQDLCPLARQWTTFAFAVEPNFRVEAFMTDGDSVDSYEAIKLQGDAAESMNAAMELFGILLSEMAEGSPLSEGFHIVSIPLGSDWTNLRSPEKVPYTLTCLATAEPEAKELLTLDTSLVEMTASSVLELRVVPAAVDVDL